MKTNRLTPENNRLTFIALALYTSTLLFMSACSGPKKQLPANDIKEKEWSAPRITLLSQLTEKNRPKTIFLSNAPKPSVINTTLRSNVESRKQKSVLRPKVENDTSNATIIREATGRGLFSTYTTDDGLSLDQVYCSYKDKWGNLWFGTNGGGVSRYDGKNFTNYTITHGLANNVIWCITQDRHGNLWFGTDGGGVSKYDGESFTNYGTAQGLADNVVFSIVEDRKNNLWFGTLKGGVSKWDGKNFTTYSVQEGLSNNAVKAIFNDSKDNIWFGTLGGGVSKWDGKSFTNFAVKEGLSGNRVSCITEDNLGSLWFGTEGKGLSKYDGKEFTSYPVFSEASNDIVLCMTRDSQGTLWIGTQKSGVVKYDSQEFVRYSTANGLANSQVRTITRDDKGNLWFGSFGSGLSKFSGNSFTNFTTAHGLANNVIFSIEEDQKANLWLGTSDGGVCLYDGQQFDNFTKADGLPRNEIYCVLEDRKGNLWFGTSLGGVSKYDGKSFTNYTTAQGLANNIVFSIVEDKKGNLWFGTSGGGVSKFDGTAFTNYTTSQGLAGNVVFSIEEDSQSNLWFGTLDGGISKFDGAGFTNYGVEQGLLDNVVWAITEDRGGNIWFGTQHGLSQIPKEKNLLKSDADKRSPLFTSFSTADGLPNNFVTQVVQGEGDILYVGTNLGICEIFPSKGSQPTGKDWTVGRTFNTQNGYPVKDVNAGLNAMFKDSKNTIWIGTGSDKTGLVRFDPGALASDNNTPLKLFINQVKINNEAIGWRSIDPSDNDVDTDSVATKAAAIEQIAIYGKILTALETDSLRVRFSNIKFAGIAKWHPLPQKLVLPYYFNNVSFDFGAIETGKNFLVNYKYFLEGYDKEWSPASHNTFATFGNINEGHYTFKVKAQSPEGVWSEPVGYSFTVLAPWWRTWLMIAVYALLIIGSILLFFRWKHKRIINQKKILEGRVAIATKQVREESEKVQAQKIKIEQTLNELKATQSQLVHAEKMASLGELTAGVAHEIQNPLNFVNNFSEISNELLDEMITEIDKGDMHEAKAIAEDVKQNLEKINHHGTRADAIVKGMLQHSRTSTGEKQLTDINALADEYLRLAYHGIRAKDSSFNAALKTDYNKDIRDVNIVPQEIGRVFLNLITNALYAVSERAKRHDPGYTPTIAVSTKELADKIEIAIKDNGSGIPNEIVDKIFQPFFTTKPTGQGTGLGLSLAYDIVKAHGGDLTVGSREGEGAEFVVSLPTGTDNTKHGAN